MREKDAHADFSQKCFVPQAARVDPGMIVVKASSYPTIIPSTFFSAASSNTTFPVVAIPDPKPYRRLQSANMGAGHHGDASVLPSLI